MEDRERPSSAPVLPPAMGSLLRDRRWMRNTVGEAGCAVYRASADGSPDLFLKHGAGEAAHDVVDEMVRLRWLGDRMPVPTVVHGVVQRDDAWLLTTAVRGLTAYQRLERGDADGRAVVDALAHFLRRLHAIPVETCPFNADHRLRMTHAHARMTAGLVDVEDFGEAHEGWTAQAVWDAMAARLPFPADPVVTHGDFSLDNILLDGDAVSGCIDVGRLGVADRYQDLAIMLDCLGEFGPALQARFRATYGLDAVDDRKLAFHLALDEFF